MPTKYEYSYSKPIIGSLWKHMVAISFVSQPKKWTAAGSFGTKDQYLSLQQEFLKFMAGQYGPLEDRWSVRWSDYGCDVRFRSEKDAGSFILFFTENPPPKIPVETFNWWV